MRSTNNSQRRYPPELRERAVRMVQEGIAARGTASASGVVTRVAKQLGIGSESLRQWVTRPRSTPVSAREPRAPRRSGSLELERGVRELRRANAYGLTPTVAEIEGWVSSVERVVGAIDADAAAAGGSA
jgi:transposase